jgi:isoaspartyl peptidase/L-asparaginase-like protein (Ntn-hydrolase superfamily)
MATIQVTGDGGLGVRTPFVVAIHGGSGAIPGYDYREIGDHMRTVILAGAALLRSGAPAVEVAARTVVELESSGLYIAGRGASPNQIGEYELDACVMDGSTGKAGAVAALQGFVSPISVARAIMDRTPHVTLVGGGAAKFADEEGFERVRDPATWYTHAASFEHNRLSPVLSSGTVGCVVLDTFGTLAAATSTSGVFGKLPGRVGDSPAVGAGTWADDLVAISCTGEGEFFLRSTAAVQVAHRIRFARQTLHSAADSVLAEIVARGGSGGLIAVDRQGNIAMPFVSTGMKRAAVLPNGAVVVEVP